MVPPPSINKVSWITCTEENGIFVGDERTNVVFFNASVLPSDVIFYGITIDRQTIVIDGFKYIKFSEKTKTPICKFKVYKVYSDIPLVSIVIIAKFFKRKPYYCEHEEFDITTSRDIDAYDTDDEESY
jgi:hypothetical protein